MDYKPTILSALETMRIGVNEKFKALAYKKAIDNLKRHNGPITCIQDVAGVAGIGEKIHAKIVEILETGTLAVATRMAAKTQGMETLLAVHGIGPVKARELIAEGITTIDQLRARPELLTDAARLGLKYYEAGLQRIPRAEMAQHEALLLGHLPPKLMGTIVGSYRRGAETSGDIDMLVTYSARVGTKEAQTLFKLTIQSLESAGYILDTLASGAKKYMGYVRIGADGIPRRLDLLLTPPVEYAYALFYFTGSDKFNVAFRKHCIDLGYSLNEHTLTAKQPGVREPPLMSSEEDIFAFVGLKYVPPTLRADELVCVKEKRE